MLKKYYKCVKYYLENILFLFHYISIDYSTVVLFIYLFIKCFIYFYLVSLIIF